MILRVVPLREHVPRGAENFLAYVQRFNIVPQLDPTTGIRGVDPASGMYHLRRARRSDQSIMGDIIPLDRLRASIELTPKFGKKAEQRLSRESSLDLWDDFWLCKWFNKELFFVLSQ